MQLAVPKETYPGENRVAMTPDTAKKLVRLGATIQIEAGMGVGSGFQDSQYSEVGAEIVTDRAALISSADMLLRLRKPELDEIPQMKRGCIHISYLDPFNEHALVRAFAEAGVT
ncbi:NAD(P)(+) transhydrogenase (Re/Si-specific) subunit alpha, partial [Congregibacter sp.]|nr:NAD(P)(+) transhydrogenase (Re/Si-specific) subunit alpha [Congregibacter sp.]